MPVGAIEDALAMREIMPDAVLVGERHARGLALEAECGSRLASDEDLARLTPEQRAYWLTGTARK